MKADSTFPQPEIFPGPQPAAPGPQVHLPTSTYRLQFNSGFRFVDGRDLVPYLSDLGITDLYSSPRYKARRGSSHGYDIANPLRVNSELGTEEDFDDMACKLQNYGMGLLLDTVPNHMAASYENPWWMDVLENGQSSSYATYFDIDWHPPISKAAYLQENRVLLPILGDLYGNVLDRGELTLKMEDTGIHVRYYDTRLPLDPKSYSAILARMGQALPPGNAELLDLLSAVERLPARDDPAPEHVMERRRDKERIKDGLWRASQSDPAFRAALDETLAAIASDSAALDALLGAQAYRLAYWKIGYEEINYRRFFDINELVGLRIEVPEVFENRYQQIFSLLREGKITGLRVDHIDGLWDPECYLRRLASHTDGAYIVVEKVLGRDETLPPEWPVAGTTGYDFLNTLNGVFVDPAGLDRLEAVYARVTGSYLPFAEQCYQSNKLVIEELFRGDLMALSHQLGALAAAHRQARDVRLSELTEALVEVTACFPIYRTYIHNSEVAPRDRGYIERTVALARGRTSPDRIADAAFQFIRSVLLLQPPPYLEDSKDDWLDFVMRYQQFTGPVMAKGLEDTATYRHNSLLSLNEVGGDALREQPPASLDDFHDFNRRRAREWPGAMNATATHDTKRGEDSRARLNVLSEIPDEWGRRLERWMEWNAPHKIPVKGALAPSASEEVLIYQTLLAVWPADLDRLTEFLTKALREAKQNSSWIAPHEEYEQAVHEFTARILADGSRFLLDFQAFQSTIAVHGIRNSLSQLILKVAAPGVPDFYQGAELWQFALVDPDNRRPVDYKRRAAMLEDLRRREAEDRIALVRELAAEPDRDEMKLFVTWRGLAFRALHRDLFARGEYIPLEARGPSSNHVVAFARRLDDQWAIAVAPRWSVTLADWSDTELILPPGAPDDWTDALTGLVPATLRLADLLREFPVALIGRTPWTAAGSLAGS
jgi:(1->4)-alpha-D-glucan 1-alpha-D-glucosylmutase